MNAASKSSPLLSRRRFLQLTALAGAGAVSSFGGSLIWSNESVRKFENDTVLPLTPWTINTYLVRGARPVLVDTRVPTDESAIRSALRHYNTEVEDPGLILITHSHYDHFGSAAALKATSNLPVAFTGMNPPD